MRDKLSEKILLNVKISSNDREYLLNLIDFRLKNKQKFVVFTPNPEILVKAYQNRSFTKVLNNADINIPDGVGVAIALGLPVIKGREFMIDILKLLNGHKMTTVLIGGSKVTMVKCEQKLHEEFPQLSIKTFVGPQVNEGGGVDTEIDRKVQKDITDRIKTMKPDMVFVGFGAPKQEYWIDQNFSDLPIVGAMAVGGAFDFYAGLASISPQWLSIIGLEWLWRLVNEPRRARRIFNAVVIFPLIVLKDTVSKLFV